jgi:UDP-N-acetylglucosamine--N-acetylmuramyl-(pentapeptide) pyrophosphoryl-undecaprenol N-acetylglucosamine transferase
MSSDLLHVVIAGGGTGGHLYPGIAVARELLTRRPAAQISFAGTESGIETQVVPREGFALDVIRSGGLKGKSMVDQLRGAALLPLSLVDAWRIVSSRQPQLVIGVGGFSSGPVVLIAAVRGVPTLLLEQNAVPGLTNRLLAPFVRLAAVTFESSRAYFGKKGFVSGNPVRPEFLRTVRTEEEPGGGNRAAPVEVLVFGGSQGAHAINAAMAEAARDLAAGGVTLRLTHQAGERDVSLVQTAYRDAGLTAEVAAFFYDMGRRMGETDLVVCRAGATTLAEIAVAGKAAILIPLPSATDDHQRKNAEAFAEGGGADVLLQVDLAGRVLAERILALAADRTKRNRMAAAARSMARPGAARAIVDRALELVGT